MFFAVFIILGILIGYLTKGKLGNLKNVELRMFYLPVAAFILSLILSKTNLYYAKHIVSYTVIIIFILVNIKKSRYFILAGLGFFSNFIVICANELNMPVGLKIEELRIYINAYNMLINNQIPGYVLATEQTKLYFLADIFYLPYWHKLGFFSLGDILLGLGGMMLTIVFMKKLPEDQTEKTVASIYAE